jgi:hypothetical protein
LEEFTEISTKKIFSLCLAKKWTVSLNELKNENKYIEVYIYNIGDADNFELFFYENFLGQLAAEEKQAKELIEDVNICSEKIVIYNESGKWVYKSYIS